MFSRLDLSVLYDSAQHICHTTGGYDTDYLNRDLSVRRMENFHLGQAQMMNYVRLGVSFTKFSVKNGFQRFVHN